MNAGRLGNAHGVNRAVTKTTPVAGPKGRVVVELECKHVLVSFVSNVNAKMKCPACAAAAKAAKKAAMGVRASDVRDELITELRKQVDYLRALNNLAPTRAKPTLVQPPPACGRSAEGHPADAARRRARVRQMQARRVGLRRLRPPADGQHMGKAVRLHEMPSRHDERWPTACGGGRLT